MNVEHPHSQSGRSRVLIEEITPQVDHGRFAAKRVVGDRVVVRARVFADGHDAIHAMLRYRHLADEQWSETELDSVGNDWWQATFQVQKIGRYEFTIDAWIDRFATWQRDLHKRVDAGHDVTVDLLSGAEIIEEHLPVVDSSHQQPLKEYVSLLRESNHRPTQIQAALSEDLAKRMRAHSDRRFSSRYPTALPIEVDRIQGRFSTWYEFFPRSASSQPGQHGTLADCRERLPYVAEMGFDILYLPPIHPIGRSFRKGKNNAVKALPDDVGSPWAIGAAEGGHKAIHPQLGTIEDFRELLSAARDLGIEIAMDIAFQCAPDHPYVAAHPDWFRQRPDGSIQYAENPPKKYQDIYPFDFESPDWQALWDELKSVLLFWANEGVRVFRVDNPHTKSFAFWEWAIAEVKKEYADAIFLAEAFTRPAVMSRLAKLGFSQSYTYFTWRNTKPELTEYLTELTQGAAREFFRPNLWPNTPDILNEFLQFGGRSGLMSRYVLAATLSAACGIYGPTFELGVVTPREPGSEEYLDSEKYQLQHWHIDAPESLRHFIARVNRIRRENPSLHDNSSLRFHPVDNEQLICYSKQTEDGGNVIVTVVNLDPHHVQSGWVDLPLSCLGVDSTQPYQMHDLLSEERYLWHGSRNFVQLNPHTAPASIFCLRKRVRSESQFEYFL